jgi:hypothetical protein
MNDLQGMCAQGQRLLALTDYLAAEEVLEKAVHLAADSGDWDTVSRGLMPLQEARRQARQRCGEGEVDLTIRLPHGVATDEKAAQAWAEGFLSQHGEGQFLVAGHDSLLPAIKLRELASKRKLYVECLLAKWTKNATGNVLVKVLAEATGDADLERSDDQLQLKQAQGDTHSYARVMKLWEDLAMPALRQAQTIAHQLKNKQATMRQVFEAYIRVIRIDNACELAHQELAACAKEHARGR